MTGIPGVDLAATVLDCPDPRALAEFYRALLGWQYAPGHDESDPAGDDWLVLLNPGGGGDLAFARVPDHRRPSWPTVPEGGHPAQLHLDLRVPDVPAAAEAAVALGATPLANPGAVEPATALQVLADPAGHPFCLVRSVDG